MTQLTRNHVIVLMGLMALIGTISVVGIVS